MQPTDWSRPLVWLAAWGKSDSLARLAANPHTETRQSPEVWSLFWRAKFFPSLHDFVYQALWKKLRVAERLSPWTEDSTCPPCKAVETVDHALGGCLFHKVMTAVLQQVCEPVHIKGQQYESGNIPTCYTFGSPQGIAQWAALAAHWTFRNTYRRGGMPTLDALLTIWVKFTALLVGWEPLAEYSQVFQLFHNRLVQFRNTGVVSRPNIVYAESCGREDHRAAKRHRKDGRKQELAIVAMQQIQEAQHRGLVVL